MSTTPTPAGLRPSPRTVRRRRLLVGLVLLLLVGGAAWLAALLLGGDDAAGPAEDDGPDAEGPAESVPANGSSDGDGPSETPEPDPRVSDASRDPGSIHVLVNRLNPLDPVDHEPEDLRTLEVEMLYPGQQMREEPAEAVEELFAAAAEEGHHLAVTTAYRDADHQQALYEGRRAESGQEAADQYTARPGYSEHQTGLAVDITNPENESCTLGECFGETPEGVWVAENAHEWGFIIRYPEGAEEITGYAYEPWHLRYVGVETAEAVQEEDVTLEEFWDEPAAPDYEEDAQDDPALEEDPAADQG